MSNAEVFWIYLAAIIQVSLLGLLGWCSWRLASWLWPTNNWAERLVVTAVLFCSLAVLLIIVPGLLGMLSAWVVAGLILAVTVLTFCLIPRPSGALEQPTLPAGVRWPALILTALTLPFALRALVLVPVDWDGLTYHLFFPAVWLIDGRVSLPDGAYPYNYFAFYPKNYELIETLFVIFARNDLLAKLLNLPLIALTSVLTGLLSRRLGGSQSAAWGAAGLIVTTPAMFSWSATTYVEPLTNVSVLASLLFALLAFTVEAPLLWRTGLLAGLAGGLAGGTKYTTTPFILLLTLAVCLVPWLRGTGRREGVKFLAAFTVGGLLTGVWWLGYNAVVTGNPVYPVPLLGLPKLEDPGRSGVYGMSIWTCLGPLLESGLLLRLWLGNPPLVENPWAVGPEMGVGPNLAFGPKFLLLAPIMLMGLLYCFDQAARTSRGQPAVKRVPWLLTAVAALVLLYTYLKIPFWGDLPNLFFGVRFAMPFVCVAVAAGCARLDQTLPANWWPRVVVAGLLLDAVVLDLRIPGFSRFWSLVLLLVLFALGSLGQRIWTGTDSNQATGGSRRAVGAWVGLVLIGALVLFPVLRFRETQRYQQLFYLSETHGTNHDRFVPAAEFLEVYHPRQRVAYTGDFVSLLYLFVGPKMDRPVIYVPTYAGRPGSYLHGGQARWRLDRAAWEENLKESGAELLLCLRFEDRQLEASNYWPQEYHWARDLQFPVLYQDDFSCIHLVRWERPQTADAPRKINWRETDRD